jgi:cytochrome b subunit of formate dehydrogenase
MALHTTSEQGKSAARGIALAIVAAFGVAVCAFLWQPARAQEQKAAPLKQDAACLECHGQPDMKSEKGKNLSIRPEQHAASAHGILGCRDCHTTIKEFPHPAKIPKVQCATCHADQAGAVPGSVHGLLGVQACSTCHGDVHEARPTAQAASGKCAGCHAQEVKELASSSHGRAAKAGDPEAPTCASCHGPVHEIRASGDPTSTVAKKRMPLTCAKCHSNPDFVSRHKMPIAHPVEEYRFSVHGRAVAAGKDGASCSDCHGSHGILPARDSVSKVSHWNVAATCAQCHKEIGTAYLSSVHGEAMKAGNHDAPVCTDCHGEHVILETSNPASPVSLGHLSLDTCGRCHGDTRIERRNDLPVDRVPSFADSYHGLAFREGSLTAANCSSCHGVHGIYRSSDQRSSVNAANLPKTCGKCHQGAQANFAMGAVHVRTSAGPAHPVVRWIRLIYGVLIPLTLGFMVLHNVIDLLAKLIRGTSREAKREEVVRMNLWFRIAHWGVMLSFPTLVYTGLALKFPEEWWAKPLLQWEGEFSFRGMLHRAAAVVLIAATAYHFVHLAVNRRDRAFLWAIIPKWRDVTDLFAVLFYNLGLSRQEPRFAKFNYSEKLEYWAFLWGTVVMAVSGFLLWFNNFVLRHFPKWVSDAATAVHWYEALLATFSILLWHFYMVIFDPVVYPMDMAWLTGKVPAEHYRRTRPEYFQMLQKLAESQEASPVSAATASRVPTKTAERDESGPTTSSKP